MDRALKFKCESGRLIWNFAVRQIRNDAFLHIIGSKYTDWLKKAANSTKKQQLQLENVRKLPCSETSSGKGAGEWGCGREALAAKSPVRLTFFFCSKSKLLCAVL